MARASAYGSNLVDKQLTAGLHSTADALERAHADLDHAEFGALVQAELRAGRTSKLHVLIVDATGLPVAGDLKGWPPGLSADNQVHNVQIEDDLIPGRSEDDDVYWPVLARRLPDGHRLLVAHGLDQAEALLDFTQGTMIAILAVSIALALGLGLLQGRALLVRIDALIDTARSIGAGRLNQRRRSRARNDRRPRTGSPARGARACPEALRPSGCGAQHPRQRVRIEPGGCRCVPARRRSEAPRCRPGADRQLRARASIPGVTT